MIFTSNTDDFRRRIMKTNRKSMKINDFRACSCFFASTTHDFRRKRAQQSAFCALGAEKKAADDHLRSFGIPRELAPDFARYCLAWRTCPGFFSATSHRFRFFVLDPPRLPTNQPTHQHTNPPGEWKSRTPMQRFVRIWTPRSGLVGVEIPDPHATLCENLDTQVGSGGSGNPGPPCNAL